MNENRTGSESGSDSNALTSWVESSAAMCPTVKSVDPENVDVVKVSLGVLSASELDAVAELLPELKEELALRWPVRDIGFSKRNPFQLNQTETAIAISLVTTIGNELVKKLVTETFDWLHKSKGAAKKARAVGTAYHIYENWRARGHKAVIHRA